MWAKLWIDWRWQWLLTNLVLLAVVTTILLSESKLKSFCSCRNPNFPLLFVGSSEQSRSSGAVVAEWAGESPGRRPRAGDRLRAETAGHAPGRRQLPNRRFASRRQLRTAVACAPAPRLLSYPHGLVFYRHLFVDLYCENINLLLTLQ